MQPKKESLDEHEDIVYEEDHGAQLVQKLRAKLRACEQERKEYLDGWQRLKADLANTRKEETARLGAAQSRACEGLVRDILPALDSFDMAFTGTAWETVDEVWRQGIEHIHAQLLRALESNGIVPIGKVGEQFDPRIHEASEERDVPDTADGAVLEIVRTGYVKGDTVLRPAQVVVAKKNEKE